MGLISNGTTIFDAGSMAAGVGSSMVFIKKLTLYIRYFGWKYEKMKILMINQNLNTFHFYFFIS